MATILIIDDQTLVREVVSNALEEEGHEIIAVGDAVSMKRHIFRSRPDIILINRIANSFNSFDLLIELKQYHPHTPSMVYLIREVNDLSEMKRSLAYLLQDSDTPRHLGLIFSTAFEMQL